MRPTSRANSWRRRLQLLAAILYVGMLVTMPFSWVHVILAVVWLGLAVVVPGDVYWRRLAAEEEREALGDGS